MRFYSPSIKIKKGLRPIENMTGEDVYLVQATGVTNTDGALHSLAVPTNLSTPDPLVQIEVLKNHIVIITTTTIYEYIANALVAKITVASAGRWGIGDFGDFILFVNSTTTISRDALSGVYSLRYDIPTGQDALNFNGQTLIVGATLL